MPKTILITRPIGQAERLGRLIEAIGGKVLLFPTIKIIPIEIPAETIKNLHTVDVVIFVSANAVEHSIIHIRSQILDKIIIAIGPGTARALASHHLTHVNMPAVYNSEGVISLLSEHALLNKDILIISGEHPREHLQQTLSEQGGVVKMMACYRRECPIVHKGALLALQRESIDAIVTTSQEGLRNLYDIWKTEREWLCAQPLLVISSGMMIQAQQYGFEQVWMADNASDEAIMKTLKYRIFT
jgi:uroporphyrinogen-III synthase